MNGFWEGLRLDGGAQTLHAKGIVLQAGLGKTSGELLPVSKGVLRLVGQQSDPNQAAVFAQNIVQVQFVQMISQHLKKENVPLKSGPLTRD